MMLIIRNTIRKSNFSPNIAGRNARKLDTRNGITRNIRATIIVRRYKRIIVKYNFPVIPIFLSASPVDAERDSTARLFSKIIKNLE